MRKKLLTLFLLLILSSFIAVPAYGVSDSATVTVSWKVPVIQSLKLLSGNGSSPSEDSVTSVFNIPRPTSEDLREGEIVKEDALVLKAESNVNWNVQVSAEDPYMGKSDDGEYKKPVRDLEVRGYGNWKTLSTNPVTIAMGSSGSYTVGVDYKVNFDKDEYHEGNYQAALTYRITTE